MSLVRGFQVALRDGGRKSPLVDGEWANFTRGMDKFIRWWACEEKCI